MKIALIGFGKMGQAVYKLALEKGHNVELVIDHKHERANLPELSPEKLEGIDVAIDFSNGKSVLKHLNICKENGVNLIIGSTGWYDQMPQIKEIVEKSKIGFLWSSNFSIGINIYYKIVEAGSKLINKFEEYDVWGHEIHHHNKADSPSGTAKILGEILLENIDRKTTIIDEKLDRKIHKNEIHFSSVRGGAVNFAHDIGFDSAADTITISHSARNRDGYALGAVKVAEWLNGKNGFFEMDDFLKSYI